MWRGRTSSSIRFPGPAWAISRYTRTETYRYDPLGRRVWREMIRDTTAGVCQTHDKSSGCRNEVTRTIWDGAQIALLSEGTAQP